MFAVVIQHAKKPLSRRYLFEFNDPVCRLSIGNKLSPRRLNKLLEPFCGRFVAADGVDLHGLKPIDLSPHKEELLFSQFYEYVLSLRGISLSVGIFDPAGRYLDRSEMTEIIAHAASTTVFTFKNADRLCREWLLSTGTCPDVVDKKAWLFGCDCVFAPQGLLGFEGELFGRGGRGIDQSRLYIPENIRRFVSEKVDLTDLYCLLNIDALDQTDSCTASQITTDML